MAIPLHFKFGFQRQIFIKDIIELMISENLVDFIDVPLLDVICMRVWQPEQPFGEVSDNRVFV